MRVHPHRSYTRCAAYEIHYCSPSIPRAYHMHNFIPNCTGRRHALGRVRLGRKSSGYAPKTTANCFGCISACLVGACVRGACSSRPAPATLEAENKAMDLGRRWVRRAWSRRKRDHSEHVGTDCLATGHDIAVGCQSYCGTESIAITGYGAAKLLVTTTGTCSHWRCS